MTTSLQFMPDTEPWRLLLLLNKRVALNMRASVALDEAGARPSDIPGLAELGWVEGRRDGAVIDMTDQDNWAQGLSTVTVRLTDAGKYWVRHSPFNLVLFGIYAVTGSTRRSAPVHAVAEVTFADFSLFQRLVSRRLVAVVDDAGEDLDISQRHPVIDGSARERVRLTSLGITLVSI